MTTKLPALTSRYMVIPSVAASAASARVIARATEPGSVAAAAAAVVDGGPSVTPLMYSNLQYFATD